MTDQRAMANRAATTHGAESFGEVLRRLRSAAALSQEALAERAGLSRNGISDLERGARLAPRLETVRLLADGLALSDDDRAVLVAAARPALMHDAPTARAASGLVSAPAPLTRLIGREAELAELHAGLQDQDVRLLTLTGPGGVGKTRLAVEAAGRLHGDYPDGVVFVDLTPLADAALVVPAIAAALGVREPVAQRLLDRLTRSLSPKRLLLLLDNCERVLAAAPELATLLAACPGLTIFATSREPFHVRGEREFPLLPLPVPSVEQSAEIESLAGVAAVALFAERAAAVQPRFALTADNAFAVAAICRRLDGLPLAIELAVARVNVLPPQELLKRLADRLPLLTGGGRDLPARQRTMRAAIAWSSALLRDDEAILFRRLGVFVGGFTLEAAERVAGEPALPQAPPRASGGRIGASSVLDLLAALIGKSLVQPMRPGDATRYTMLETVREFALEQLAASGETDVLAERHAAWCITLAEWVRQSGLLSQARGSAILEAEQPNLRAALDWLLARGEVDTALHLAGQMAVYWLAHGPMSEGRAWLERSLEAGDGAPTAARAEALVGLNMLLWWTEGGFDRAEQLLVEAEAVARAAGDAGALAYARLHQGYVAVYRGDFARAVARGEECLTTAGAIAQGFSLNGARWLLARASLERGENERAAGLYAQLLASSRAEGDEISVVNSLIGQAILAERRGETEHALAGLAEAAALCRGSGNRVHASECLDWVTMMAAPGRPEATVRLFAAADALRAAAVGEPPVLVYVGDRSRHEQTLAEARAALGAERSAQAWAVGAAFTLDEAIAEATVLARLAPSPDHPAAGAGPETGAEGFRGRWTLASSLPGR